MTIAVRAHTKMMSAVMAAGLVTAAAPVWVPPTLEAAPVISSEVLPASFVTDLLEDFGGAVGGAVGLVVSPIYGVISIPLDALTALVTSLQNPALTASVLSFVTQRYLNPDMPYGGMAFNIKAALEKVAAALPFPIDDWTEQAIAGITSGIGSVFDQLPDREPGGLAFEDNAYGTPLGRLLLAVQSLVSVPVAIVSDVIRWLAYLPAELEASVESALRDPREIPGLLGNLVHSVLNLNDGLLGEVAIDLLLPLFALPTVGDRIAEGYFGVADGFEDLLNTLFPAPVTPTPFPTAALVSDVPTPDARLLTLDVSVDDGFAAPADPEPAGGTDGVVDDVVDDGSSVVDASVIGDELTEPGEVDEISVSDDEDEGEAEEEIPVDVPESVDTGTEAETTGDPADDTDTDTDTGTDADTDAPAADGPAAAAA